MLETLLTPLHYEYMMKAIFVSAVIGGVCAFLSCFITLKGWSLMGDALSHSVVPGVAVAYYIGWPFAAGAFVTGLLAAKWLFLTLMGMMQLTVMFLWGRLAFGLDLFHHLPGFFVMTAFTAAAAAGFGLVLATLARTRAQLSGMSTIIILTMSALGGSMFPRFLMSETMQRFGLLTFNAWALDGYLKVFWRDSPIWALWPQVVVLATLTAVFMTLARTFARRWEAA